MVCKIIFCTEFPNIPHKAGRKTRRRRRRTQAIAKRYAFHANAKIPLIRQKMNLNLLTLREMNYKDHTKFFRLILLLSGDMNLNPGPTQISETWSVFKKRGLHFVHLI